MMSNVFKEPQNDKNTNIMSAIANIILELQSSGFNFEFIKSYVRKQFGEPLQIKENFEGYDFDREAEKSLNKLISSDDAIKLHFEHIIVLINKLIENEKSKSETKFQDALDKVARFFGENRKNLEKANVIIYGLYDMGLDKKQILDLLYDKAAFDEFLDKKPNYPLIELRGYFEKNPHLIGHAINVIDDMKGEVKQDKTKVKNVIRKSIGKKDEKPVVPASTNKEGKTESKEQAQSLQNKKFVAPRKNQPLVETNTPPARVETKAEQPVPPAKPQVQPKIPLKAKAPAAMPKPEPSAVPRVPAAPVPAQPEGFKVSTQVGKGIAGKLAALEKATNQQRNTNTGGGAAGQQPKRMLLDEKRRQELEKLQGKNLGAGGPAGGPKPSLPPQQIPKNQSPNPAKPK